MAEQQRNRSSGCCNYICEANREGIGALICDRRGDWWPVVSALPNSLFIPFHDLRFNLFEPPPGVSRKLWVHVVVARLTLDLGLLTAAQSYLIRLMAELLEKAEDADPTLLDLLDLLENKKPKPRSSEEGYRDRLLGRMRALVEVAGEPLFDVQKGFPICQAVEEGRVVVLDARIDKLVGDLLASTLLFWIYHRRLYSQDPFTHRSILCVLDEQRSLIRDRSQEPGIPDIETLFTSSRALGIGYVVCEQVPSMISRALVTSCKLRLGFRCARPEARTMADYLDLNPEQAEKLPNLKPGHCIARVDDDRIPFPFRLEIPQPEFLQ